MPINNAAERALRGIAVGRRNWTFAGSDRGGERTAAHVRPANDHDSSITAEAPDVTWGGACRVRGGAAIPTVADGNVTLFAVAEHWNGEGLGWHVAKHGNRYAAAADRSWPYRGPPPPPPGRYPQSCTGASLGLRRVAGSGSRRETSHCSPAPPIIPSHSARVGEQPQAIWLHRRRCKADHPEQRPPEEAGQLPRSAMVAGMFMVRAPFILRHSFLRSTGRRVPGCMARSGIMRREGANPREAD
jgi:hypothetical protein